MIAGIVARLRSLWQGVRQRDDVETAMDEEFRLHLQLRTQDLVRAGLSPVDAARQARLEFGSSERFKDEARTSRGLRRIDQLRFSWLDFKLGFRMLLRYPGLTLVGGFAIAFGVWVGAGTFEFLSQVVNPTLPLPDGDRIVALYNVDIRESDRESRAIHDFERWRRELRSVEELGAFRPLERNLNVAGATGEPVLVAEISASAFRLMRTPALLGRTLVDDDARAGATNVVVISHAVWQARFGGDPAVLGRPVHLGTTPGVVVGVMPEGFGFPLAHDVWMPFRLSALDYERGAGPSIGMFGRLAPGVTLAEAQAELAVLGQRASTDFPLTHQYLRPRLRPYARSWMNIQGTNAAILMAFNLPLVMQLVLICSNVALLMFARAASRETELVVRSALGASRSRIITQLFAEALVLGVAAAAVGLAAARFGLQWAFGTLVPELLDGNPLPFWLRSSLSPATVAYGFLLAVVAAVVAGVMPALKITRGMGVQLRSATAGGGGPRFGGVWTTIIVLQVAVTTAFPAIALFVHREGRQIETHDLGFPANQYLGARVELDREAALAQGDSTAAAVLGRYARTIEELERRLEADPAITAVTWVDKLPRTYHGWTQIEVDEGAAQPRDPRGHRVSVASIAPDYFDALGTPLLYGREFHSGDLAPEARTVIVNEPFVRRVMGGGNPVGRRVRHLDGEGGFQALERGEHDQPGPWYEIIGVARDIGTTNGWGRAGIYRPVAAGGAYPVHIVMGVAGDPRSFASDLRDVAADIDPTLRLYEVMPLSAVTDRVARFYAFWVRITAAVSGVALLLSLAAIYSVMSFTVSRRTREIGVRVALGSDPRRIVTAIFRRPLRQVALGVLAGATFVAFMVTQVSAIGAAVEPLHQRTVATEAWKVVLVAGYAVMVTLVCLLACLVPTRRALRIQPTDALRMDA